MSWILFFVWLFFFSWIITVIPFIKRSGLPKFILCALFVVKVAAGIAYFHFFSLPANKSRSDTWRFYDRSIPETDLLLRDPLQFAGSLFTSNYSTSGELFSDQQSYWNDVKDEVMVKLMAITNVFTNANYYGNVIWFNFFFFIGLMAFFRFIQSLYPVNIYILAAIIFLIPSFLFWCSGIHKDGFVFTLLSIILYTYNGLLLRRKFVINFFVILICLAPVFLLRNYIVLALIPCMLIGFLLNRWSRQKSIIIISALCIGLLVMFAGKYLHPALDFPKYIADKQSQFKQLDGNSEIQTVQLQPTIRSFVTFLPVAADIGFLRPHLNENGISSKVASIEIILFWLIFLLCIFIIRKYSIPPVVIVCWMFSFSILVIIGYTVNFSGAVVRYRSLVLPLLLTPAVAAVLNQFHIYKKNI